MVTARLSIPIAMLVLALGGVPTIARARSLRTG
jgi:hypothetical protein